MEEEQKTTLRKKKKRRKKNYLVRLILLIAILVGLYFLLTSSFFDVERIVVENNHHYTREQIIEKTKAKTGENIFGVKTQKMKETLLADPYIKSARVKRSLPGNLVILVEERKEAAAVPFDNSYIIVDRGGLVLRIAETDPKLTLLLGMTIKSMDTGKPLEVEETSVLTETLFMLETMEDTDLFFKKIDISNVIIKAYIYDHLLCQGTPEHILESMKSGILETVLYDLYTNGVERGIINVGGDGYYSFNPMVE